MIDTPRWPWRGHLWAHLISDDSLDELHSAARSLDLRYVSFGCDHYDVPDTSWSRACEVAELVDSRDIVRSLRASGLRVGGGKRRKAWRPAPVLPRAMRSGAVDDWLGAMRERVESTNGFVEVLTRPHEWVVLHLFDHDEVALGELRAGPEGLPVYETVRDGRYSLELVIADPEASAVTR